MKFKTTAPLILLFLLLPLLGMGAPQQNEEEPDDEYEDSEDAALPQKKTPKPIDMKGNFSQEFQSLLSLVDTGPGSDSINSTSIPSPPPPGSSSPPPRRPRPTTEMTRLEEIGSGVNGILGSVGVLDIPGIVDGALSIRNNGPVRELVSGIMHTLFCSPILNNFSSCGGRLGKPKPKPSNDA